MHVRRFLLSFNLKDRRCKHLRVQALHAAIHHSARQYVPIGVADIAESLLRISHEAVALDGEAYAAPENARFAQGLGANGWSSRRLSVNAIEATYFRARKPVGTIRREISSDGRTFTSTHDGIRPSREKVAYTNAFDKQ